MGSPTNDQLAANTVRYWPFWVALAALVAFWAIGLTRYQGYALDLGSATVPQPRYLTFLGFWIALGSLAIGLLAYGFAHLASTFAAADWRRVWVESDDRKWLVGGSRKGTC